MGGYLQVICKCYAVLHNGLEHPQILVSEQGWGWDPGANPLRIQKLYFLHNLYHVSANTSLNKYSCDNYKIEITGDNLLNIRVFHL